MVQISVDPNSAVSSFHQKAVELLELHEHVDDTCLRPIHRSGRLLPPVPEDVTMKEAELKPGSTLGVFKGKAPGASQIFLSFILGNELQEGQEQDIILEETLTVKECLQQILQKAGLPIEAGWHLRKMDWCYEAGDPLSEEDSSLKDL
ncbi:unnamed protein product, partial [Staurois parvus]